MDNYKKQKYNQVFESVYEFFKNQKENNKNYNISSLESFLQSLYSNEGNNWLGRSDLKEASNSATIAACESLLVEWKEELGKNF